MYYHYSALLRKLRTERRWTQEDASKVIGLCRSSYDYHECGRSAPNLLYIIKLARTYGVDYSVFLDAVEKDMIENGEIS